MAAKEHPYGYSIRHSSTLNKELLYVAKQTNIENKSYVIRMARGIDEIIAAFTAVSLKTALLFGLFALFAYRMILGIGSSIENETRKILNFLDEMGSKEKKRTIYSTYATEFAKITELLTQTSEKLSKRRKQKSKYTARLKLANRQKDDIISAISHEFKNPIAVISGYSQTLIEDKNINPSTTEQFLEKIHTNAYKLSDMIDRLRLSIRLDEHRQPLQRSQCDMLPLIQHVIETLQISYPSREVQLHLSTSCVIEVDITLMEIAISNLIENALKYSEDNPIEIILSSRSIQVIDHGIGIAPKEIEKITRKFYRVTDNRWNNSMGIGLSLVSHIVTMHGFTLSIQSQLGSGPTFEILL
jgi:signal transduction histidine kinase